MRFLKLLPAAILPALFACKSTDTRYESDRTAQTGAYSESERATRDSDGSNYAHSDYNRGVSTVDLRASGQSGLKGTATLLKSQDGDSSPRLIVHLENAEPGTYQVALASSCDFNGAAWDSASAGAGISEGNRSDRSFGGSAGVTGDAEGDESGSANAGAGGSNSASGVGISGSAGGGSAGVRGSAELDEDADLDATARVDGDLEGDAEGEGMFGGQLGMNKNLGEITVGEDGTGHFEETLTDARIEQSAAIVVRRTSEGSELAERSASEGQMDGTLIAACGLISLPATGADWNASGEAQFNNDPRQFDSDGQNLGDMNDQDTVIDD